jgi:hypothetical protein
MPIFYSNIRTRDDYAEDMEGEEFAHLEAAKLNAEESLLIMAGEEIKSQSPVRIRVIEISDAHKQVLAVVSLPDVLPKVLPPEVIGRA